MKKYIAISLLVLVLFNISFAGYRNLNLQKIGISVESGLKKELERVKICALRVDFQTDDKEVTSGNGKFLYEAETADTLNSAFKIDPVPHNRAYFKDHIVSLSNFYYHASNGNLMIDTEQSEVYPLNEDSTYTLPHEMDHYHPFLEEDSIDIKLAELFIEAVQLADDEVNFADYDVVVIFHAGVGQDFAFDLDPTPYDIPSVYLNQNDLSKAVANPENFQGIEVDGGATLLNECIILPESQNHTLYENWEEVFYTDDPFDYQIGLNGTFAFMFGFYLGIPGMYNTETGDAGIGRWGMMDQGSVNLNGLVPALPNAWVREYMGWIDPVEAKSETQVMLKHAESGADTLAWKVRIDDDEYYLVENRCNFLKPLFNLDTIRNRQYKEQEDNETFPSVLPLIRDSIGAVFSEETGVLLSVPRYDYGLPGSGLLIWHIDETVINANISTNSINNDKERRGVSLEEADGAEDIGYPAVNIFTDVQNGWGFDAWYATNDGYWDINADYYAANDSTFIGFTDHTFPNTKNNDNVYTGIRIDSIGQAGEVMSFTIAFDQKEGNFPVAFDPETQIQAMTFCDYDNDGNEDIIVAADRIYLYTGSGLLVSKVEYFEAVETVNNLQISYNDDKLFLVFEFGTRIKIQTYEIDDDGEIEIEKDMEIVNAEITSNIQYVNDQLVLCILGGAGYFIAQISDDDEEYFDISNKIIQTGYSQNKFFYLSETGDILYSDKSNPGYEKYVVEISEIENATAFALFNHSNDMKTNAVITSDKNLVLVKDLTANDREITSVAVDCQSAPIISDINGDGSNDIVVAGAGKIYAYDEKLLLLPNFPVNIPNLHKDKEFGESIYSANLDGNDKTLEIIGFVKDGGMIAYNHKGEVLKNYPIATITPANNMSGLYTDNNKTYVLTVGNKMMNSLLISENPLDEKSWGKNGYDGNSRFYHYLPAEKTEVDDALLVKNRTFCWPNPVEDNISYIRYYVTENCEVKINIFNMAGQFIKSFSQATPNLNQYNEIAWNVTDIESGVYYAIVKAEKGSQSETKTVKIMIIK